MRDFEVRAFAAPSASRKTRSPAASTPASAQWLIADGHLPERYVAAQGSAWPRRPRPHRSATATARSGSAASPSPASTAGRRCERVRPCRARIDHLVIAARTLDEGVRVVRSDARRRAGPGRRAPADGHAQPPAAIATRATSRAPTSRSSRSIRSEADRAPRDRRRWFDLDDADAAGRRWRAGTAAGPLRGRRAATLDAAVRGAGAARHRPRRACSKPRATRRPACCGGASRCATTASGSSTARCRR